MVNFKCTEVRPMGRTASGVKGIELDDNECVVGVTTSLEGEHILAMTSKGFGKLTPVMDEDGSLTYRITKRGAKGVTTLKATDKVGDLIAVRAVNLEDATFPPPPLARHYNSDLSIWLSADPMSDKYPGLSPYTYCLPTF